MISCIIPCYGSEKTIAIVVDELRVTLENGGVSDYEIILVNDSSPDKVYSVIVELCKNDARIKAIDLAKNFGQHGAVMAGINHAKGDTLVFLDDDGQASIPEIWKLLEALNDDCDVVFGKYDVKQHVRWKNIGSSINAYMTEALLGKPKDLSITSFFCCKRFVADEIKKYVGSYPYLTGLILRTTKHIKNVSISHRVRVAGESNYTMKKVISLWLNGFTAFSVKPLRIATAIGFITALGGFIYGLYVIIRRLFISPDTSVGWSSTMAVLLFIGGMIMLMLGLIGEYIGRMYININNSPQYVIRERIGFNGNDNEK